MTRQEPARFLRSAPTMAHPGGRLLVLRGADIHVLAPDGWIHLGHTKPAGATWLTADQAEQWCRDAGLPAAVLDSVPT
ncbi:hypothetical protein [Actinokineospora terrae]|uniref:Uncharacterized protein n=1 Tax=Actinokineospora terrae TaxID=155974 RepID=A0A1H9UHF4_9PSEU|nr:hypothetical protein [Actinokineospora terrae]SES08792.1 hypothetical protein SAMN04487818_107238 [Actinokineospora terrae]